jgi:hypothetical protein
VNGGRRETRLARNFCCLRHVGAGFKTRPYGVKPARCRRVPSVNLLALLARLSRDYRKRVWSACIVPRSAGHSMTIRLPFFVAIGSMVSRRHSANARFELSFGTARRRPAVGSLRGLTLVVFRRCAFIVTPPSAASA